jgi:aspartate 1-decarboxylase
MNGAAARLTAEGDKIIIISYAQYTEEEIRTLVPQIAFVDDENHLTEKREVPLIEMLPDTEVAFV